MNIFLRFDLERRLFLRCLPSKLSSEIQICYVDLVRAVNVSVRGFDFSHPRRSLTAQKYGGGRVLML